MKDGQPTDLAALGLGGMDRGGPDEHSVQITDGARIPMGAPA
jgi:nitrite reductase (NADH) large subunit